MNEFIWTCPGCGTDYAAYRSPDAPIDLTEKCLDCYGRKALAALPDDVRPEVEELIDQGKHVHAIKLIRESSGSTLRGAHVAMELLAQNRRNSSGSMPRNAS